MSDFVFTVRRTNPGQLTKHVQEIYHEDPPQVVEFHGSWGSLAVSRNLHMGFDPLETEQHICIVIGGPVLTFTSNLFLGGDDRIYGTRELLSKWTSGEDLHWDEDLSGPFVVLKLDKKKRQVEVITDLMSFIPVYQSEHYPGKVIGTHVDVVARVADCEERRDPVSIVDFILNGVVTYPYTLYSEIKQVSPASKHLWTLGESVRHQEKAYWFPREENQYRSLNEAADDLRMGIQSYVNAVTEGMDRVALFLSGGEDSRTVLGMLPRSCERHAFIFLDQMNREGRIAQAAARAYGASFTMLPRGELWYFKVLQACSDLVGTGAQYRHVHSYGFHKVANLDRYRAVFGGFLSDTFLKLHLLKKVPGVGRVNFLPYQKSSSQRKRKLSEIIIVHSRVLAELKARTDDHLKLVRSVRSEESVEEWFNLWPISMQSEVVHLHGNRRLFASYEPFTAKTSVKVSAAVPQEWKMRRRLFQKMAQPLLRPSKYLIHSNGWMPYYPWYMNVLIRRVVWFWRGIHSRFGLMKGNQGPWSDFSLILESTEWKEAVKCAAEAGIKQEEIFSVGLGDLFTESYLDVYQKLNMMQIIYQCHKQ